MDHKGSTKKVRGTLIWNTRTPRPCLSNLYKVQLNWTYILALGQWNLLLSQSIPSIVRMDFRSAGTGNPVTPFPGWPLAVPKCPGVSDT